MVVANFLGVAMVVVFGVCEEIRMMKKREVEAESVFGQT